LTPRAEITTNCQEMSVHHRCSRCGSTNTDRLPRSRVIDKVLGVLKLRPYRCRHCYSRFYGPILTKMRTEETLPTNLHADNRKDEQISLLTEESARFKKQMIAVLKGTKVQLDVIDDGFFGPNGRYRIIVRGLSKEETREIVEAVIALNLIEK
jgi:DNA-directed RNA polymerase subunit RPC12/RpoP